MAAPSHAPLRVIYPPHHEQAVQSQRFLPPQHQTRLLQAMKVCVAKEATLYTANGEGTVAESAASLLHRGSSAVWHHLSLLDTVLELVASPQFVADAKCCSAFCQLLVQWTRGFSEDAARRRQFCVSHGALQLILGLLSSSIEPHCSTIMGKPMPAVQNARRLKDALGKAIANVIAASEAVHGGTDAPPYNAPSAAPDTKRKDAMGAEVDRPIAGHSEVISALSALTSTCIGYDESSHSRKQLAIDQHALEILTAITRIFGGQTDVLYALFMAIHVFWGDMAVHYSPVDSEGRKYGAGEHHLGRLEQASGRYRRAIARLELGAAQFDALCYLVHTVKLRPTTDDKETTLASWLQSEPTVEAYLDALMLMLPTVLHSSATRVACVVRARFVQEAATICLEAQPQSQWVQRQAESLLTAYLSLYIKAAVREIVSGRSWRKQALAF